MASHAKTQRILPKHVFNDLIRFIHEKYQGQLPNSLIVAQAFILEHQDYGSEYGLPAIYKAIEDGIKQGIF
jgi:hypothetical protein